jgi:hypothetical protein
MSPANGTLTSSGLYTAPAPAVITAVQAVAITAISTADPTKSATAIVTLQPGTPPAVTDAILHWKLDENSGASAMDASGYGNHGRLASGASWTSGKLNWAVSLNGTTSGYISRAGMTNFPTTDLTVAFWMRSSDTSRAGTLVSYASAQSANDFLIYDYRNLQFYVAGVVTGPTGVKLNDGQWNHLAVTWQSSNGSLKVYRNRALVYSRTIATGRSHRPGGTFLFGQDQDAIGGGFDPRQAFVGTVDDLRVYKRVLSSNEIGML